jgi:hypothetical protein
MKKMIVGLVNANKHINRSSLSAKNELPILQKNRVKIYLPVHAAAKVMID